MNDSAPSRLLLVEDDINLATLLKEYLTAKGFETELHNDGEEGYKAFVSKKFDLCIFDIMMPKKDGYTLAHEVRQLDTETPIVFLTAKNQKEDILDGFRAGADDFMTKPFSMEELFYRIEAILRRTRREALPVGENHLYKLGTMVFDANRQELSKGEEVTKLTTKESELLRLLASNRNKVLERNHALRTIWAEDNYFNARSMDVYITKLRKLLKDEAQVQIINIHGKGFKLVTPD